MIRHESDCTYSNTPTVDSSPACFRTVWYSHTGHSGDSRVWLLKIEDSRQKWQFFCPWFLAMADIIIINCPYNHKLPVSLIHLLTNTLGGTFEQQNWSLPVCYTSPFAETMCLAPVSRNTGSKCVAECAAVPVYIFLCAEKSYTHNKNFRVRN